VEPVHDLARGNEWSATYVPIPDVLSQSIFSSNVTCGISWCSEGSPARYCQLVIIFNHAYAG